MKVGSSLPLAQLPLSEETARSLGNKRKDYNSYYGHITDRKLPVQKLIDFQSCLRDI